ncbi:MAG: Ig domain protein, group 2 domain protein [Candidatus Moranbacteria bacterium GW2011_GWC1_45_18]|nr:MAG: Ig domain protein, group 2 domain protein [Candidatus Moranbacteria bacterium GW2011_GWF2_44_10]KKU00882.1 MAG: Ig domain protein, group 2 domain protein [Candidatus Moranbacteria bacterium GW2011_GWC1_45_18]OGI34567.1 MAG: hypothetical protein A2407_02630 [Candidatus Moranbacteria bacterium RIFOXYC1_FULL_44_8]OGI40319.1 MAG: hypothetical protein A2374_04095 [Candidatus Moranbacteria bacterium RIFOXYB1_FULL_44_23]OGI43320.1 MAG: hypothetical protein A2593_05580 [Candidatus Moranbacteria
MKKTHFLTFVAILAFIFAAETGNNSGWTATVNAQGLVFTSIKMDPSWTAIADGQSMQFSATALDQSGNPMVTQPTFFWSVDNPTQGAVNQNGLFTPLSNGQMTIYAKADNKMGTAHITVTPATEPTIKSVEVSPLNANIGLGGTLQFTATAFDQNWTALDTQPLFSWSLNNSAIGSIDPASGLFTALAPGMVMLTASSIKGAATWMGTANVTIQNAPPVLAKINVAPPNPLISSGTTRQFSTETLDQYGNPINVFVTWSSDNQSVGTVDPISGLLTGIAPGTANVTAASGSISGSAPFTVQNAPPVVTTLNVSPSNPSISVGSAQQFSAISLDQYGDPITANISWTQGNKAVGKIDQNGLFFGENPGTTTITASSGTVSAKIEISVSPLVMPLAGTNDSGDLSLQELGIVSVTKDKITILAKTSTDSDANFLLGTNKNNVRKNKKKIARGTDGATGSEHTFVFSGLRKNKNHYWKLVFEKPDGSQKMETAIFRTKTLKK